MKQFIVRAEKSPEPDDPENWNVKVIGLNAEEAKDWSSSGFGKNWTIRYTLPSEESFPCFLLAKRTTESGASILAQGTAEYIEKQAQFNVISKNTKVAPGTSYVFNLMSASSS